MTMNQGTTEVSESNPFSALGEALEAAAESIGDARSEASADAKVAAAKVQVGVSTGAYYAAYGISYGLVFSGVFLKELLPTQNPIRRGFEDGAVAAIDAARSGPLWIPSEPPRPRLMTSAPAAKIGRAHV